MVNVVSEIGKCHFKFRHLLKEVSKEMLIKPGAEKATLFYPFPFVFLGTILII